MTEVRALVDGRQLAKELKWLKRAAGTSRSVTEGYVKIEVADHVVNLTAVKRKRFHSRLDRFPDSRGG